MKFYYDLMEKEHGKYAQTPGVPLRWIQYPEKKRKEIIKLKGVR